MSLILLSAVFMTVVTALIVWSTRNHSTLSKSSPDEYKLRAEATWDMFFIMLAAIFIFSYHTFPKNILGVSSGVFLVIVFSILHSLDYRIRRFLFRKSHENSTSTTIIAD